MTIERWLEEFTTNWATHNIDDVLKLFTDDVEYWETPYYKLESIEHIRQEWQAILTQKDIELQTKIFSSNSENKHTVLWRLHYIRDGSAHNLAGTYLIRLNSKGLCDYFYCVSEHQ